MEPTLPKDRSTSRVTIGVDGKINSRDVAEILGCSISAVALLRKKGKVRAQNIGGEYWYEATEIYRAKDTGLIRPRPRNKTNVAAATKPTSTREPKRDDCGLLQFKYSKERFEFIKLALGASNKTPVEYVTEKLDALYEQIKAKLSTIET